MAFFKFRKAADEPASAPLAPQSLEAMRQRAKYRLLGASVLVLLGVIGFPLLFDKQPRPIAVDTPIDIPDRNKVQPLTLPAAQAPEVPSAPVAAPVSPPAVVTRVNKPGSAEALDPEAGVITEMAQPEKPSKNIEGKAVQVPVQKASSATKKVAKDPPHAAQTHPPKHLCPQRHHLDDGHRLCASLTHCREPYPHAPVHPRGIRSRSALPVVRGRDVTHRDRAL